MFTSIDLAFSLIDDRKRNRHLVLIWLFLEDFKMKQQKIIVSVTNDLATDQRVAKVCNTLSENGYSILLIGRKLKNSVSFQRDYPTSRMRLFFNKGALFYAEYNLRLFFKLLFTKKDVLLANDLDTLLPNYLVSVLFNVKLVYDSHELYTEVPELINRPKVRAVWERIERFIFPKLKNVYTVNSLIADFYNKKYQVPVGVIRNIAPQYKGSEVAADFKQKVKGDRKMLILQGAGINIDRGGEEAVEMMQYLENTVLYIIGSGDVFGVLKEKINDLQLKNKVVLMDKMPYEELMKYTQVADLGLSLDKNTNLNYEYSLPNKVFDYIQAQTPLLVSNRKAIAELVNENNIGRVIDTHESKEMAAIVTDIFRDDQQYQVWCENLISASTTYSWEKEAEKLMGIYSNLK